jgi:hypothetical protein
MYYNFSLPVISLEGNDIHSTASWRVMCFWNCMRISRVKDCCWLASLEKSSESLERCCILLSSRGAVIYPFGCTLLVLWVVPHFSNPSFSPRLSNSAIPPPQLHMTINSLVRTLLQTYHLARQEARVNQTAHSTSM